AQQSVQQPTQHGKQLLKSPMLRVQECEYHLNVLEEAHEAYQQGDILRYKTVAGELRVLVCDHGRNKPILLDMMDHLNFGWAINPSVHRAHNPTVGLMDFKRT